MAEIGDRVGPFVLAERITRGRHSSLFRGTRADGPDREPRDALVRVAEDPNDHAVSEALLAEYEILRAMQGDDRLPRAVGLYPGLGALAIEYVANASLRDVLHAAALGKVDLDVPTVLDVLIEVAYALRHVHAIVRPEGRLVHGALTADVVRIAPDGRVVVFGFGAPDELIALAPEQVSGVRNDPRTDQWLLGALALELLRFVPDAPTETPATSGSEVLARMQRQHPALGRVLSTLLSPLPTNRYDPEERMLRELLAVARQAGGPSRRAEVAARALRVAATLRSEPALTPTVETPIEPPPPFRPAQLRGGAPTMPPQPSPFYPPPMGSGPGPAAPPVRARAEPAVGDGVRLPVEPEVVDDPDSPVAATLPSFDRRLSDADLGRSDPRIDPLRRGTPGNAAPADAPAPPCPSSARGRGSRPASPRRRSPWRPAFRCARRRRSSCCPTGW